jgi:hypothetical protein
VEGNRHRKRFAGRNKKGRIEEHVVGFEETGGID